MFKKIGDLSIKRNLAEAILFYLIYGSLGILLCGLITSLFTSYYSTSNNIDLYSLATKIAPILGGIYTFIIAMIIVFLKHKAKDTMAIMCAILGTFASSALGLILGFIPVAVLSSFSCEE